MLDRVWLEWLGGDRTAAAAAVVALDEVHAPTFFRSSAVILLASLQCLEDECESASEGLAAAAPLFERMQRIEPEVHRLQRWPERRARIAILARTGNADRAVELNAGAMGGGGEWWHDRAVAFAEAERARARGELEAAEIAYAGCAEEGWCLYEILRLQDARGDAAAAQSREAIHSVPSVDLVGAQVRVLAARKR